MVTELRNADGSVGVVNGRRGLDVSRVQSMQSRVSSRVQRGNEREFNLVRKRERKKV